MLALLLLAATAANAQFVDNGDGGNNLGGQTGPCCTSCGYLLCESSGECYRPGSETCELEVNEHGCPMDCSQWHTDFDVIDCTDGSVVKTESWSSVGNCVLTKFTETFQPTMEPSGGLDNTGLVGGNDEETGCCTSCGYVQCKLTGECYRPWLVEEDFCPEVEEGTPAPTILIGGQEGECCGSCGEILCESSGECYRPWLGGCEFEVNEYGCPDGCDQYHMDYNVIDCSDGSVLRTESWGSIGHCVDEVPTMAPTRDPTTLPTEMKTRQVKTAEYCAKLDKAACKKKNNKEFCKFKKNTGCGQAKGAPDMMTPPKDMYDDYSATCLVSSKPKECRSNGCVWANQACAPSARGSVKCNKMKDTTMCFNYGCKVRNGKCKGKARQL